jgi:integrase
MSAPSQSSNPLHQHGRSGTSIRHSKDRALNERQFELLLEGALELSDSPYYYAADPPLVVYALGRLGLRRGELAHLKESWVDFREKMIRIPAHEPCQLGDDGGPCGLCRQSAKQRVEHADDLTMEEALNWTWAPKTEAGARDVFFGHDVRAELYLERYFSNPDYTQFEASGTAISRRVKKAAEEAAELEPENVHPHGLRATAATHMASKGIGQYQLMQFFGWKQASTAENYISRNSVNTARQLQGLDTR